MQIEERSAGDVTVLDLKGKMTLGEGDELLKDKINSLLQQGRRKVVLNLEEVPYIDSAGLGMLLMQYNQALETSPMFAVILLLAVIGFLMNYAVTLIERRYCFWAQRSTATAQP